MKYYNKKRALLISDKCLFQFSKPVKIKKLQPLTPEKHASISRHQIFSILITFLFYFCITQFIYHLFSVIFLGFQPILLRIVTFLFPIISTIREYN